MPDELLEQTGPTELLELVVVEGLEERSEGLELLEIDGELQVVQEPVVVAELLESLEPFELFEVAIQGPPGRDGVGSTTFAFTAPFPISGHRLVIRDGAGLLAYANAGEPSHRTRVVGLTLNAAAEGEQVVVQWFGSVVEPSWSWDTTEPVWLGADGVLTQVPPASSGAAFALLVGFAPRPTELFIDMLPAVLLAT